MAEREGEMVRNTRNREMEPEKTSENSHTKKGRGERIKRQSGTGKPEPGTRWDKTHDTGGQTTLERETEGGSE